MARLMVVGGGKMGEALLGGLIASGWNASDIVVVEQAEERRSELAAAHEGLQVQAEASEPLDTLIAVKPQHVESVCQVIGPLGVTRVLSIAAGITTSVLESWLPNGVRAVRCMPTTPALVGAGMAGLTAGSAATADDLNWASEILSSVGEVVVLAEEQIDAVTGVSGSGPAYLFLMAEALTAAGIEQGLDPVTADLLSRQTLLGAARLLSESGTDPAVLRKNVTSPGGTTAAGLAVFEEANYRQTVANVVRAAADRSRELGQA